MLYRFSIFSDFVEPDVFSPAVGWDIGVVTVKIEFPVCPGHVARMRMPG
jgi:hypothetical protein